MSILAWIIIGVWLFYLANRHDKRMNENFMSMGTKIHALEERIYSLECENEDKDKTIKFLQGQISDLEDRASFLEKPYERDIFD
ncbi:hypothetical protein [Acinetobacter sp. YH12140]|uniref:hypothetical protein n=1 Tax=Acinetobacter sp. YH12140 TaxID=2601124 RepID=UPI0015D3FB57|nr:hypothetical protein [Acinetobacter sp. YH12140]